MCKDDINLSYQLMLQVFPASGEVPCGGALPPKVIPGPSPLLHTLIRCLIKVFPQPNLFCPYPSIILLFPLLLLICCLIQEDTIVQQHFILKKKRKSFSLFFISKPMILHLSQFGCSIKMKRILSSF